MSGAKAVRVITREERIARGQRLFAKLDAQIAEWSRLGDKQGLITEEDKASVLESSKLLHALLDTDAFDQLESQVPMQIEYLQNNMEERISKRAVKRQQERTVQRRLRATAAKIVEMLEASSADVDPLISETLKKAVKGQVSDAQVVERAISAGIGGLASDQSTTKLTDEQKTYARQLEGANKVETLSNWLTKGPPADDDLGQKVDQYIATLEVAEGREVAAPYVDRAEVVAREPNSAKRRILLDSLILDLANEEKERKRKRALIASATSLRTQLGEISELREKELLQELESIAEDWEDMEIESSSITVKRAKAVLEEYDRQAAAKARRIAMLEAFSQLGYEIREGLETAWVNDKRIVIRKSATIDHGVELSGNAEGGRLQVQAVSFKSPSNRRDKQRDVDIETAWCSEFQVLQKILDENGGEVLIERAKSIGENPVKVIELMDVGRKRDLGVRIPKKKSRRE
jgi:hypothetical protein